MSDFNFDDAFNPNPKEEKEELVTQDSPVDEAQEKAIVEESNQGHSEEAAQEEQSTTEEHEEVDPKTGKAVPLGTFLDMRDKMKEQREAAERYQRELEEFKRQHAAKEEVVEIDPLINPQEYAKSVEDKIAQAVFNERLQSSHRAALKTYGKADTDAAVAWAQSLNDPRFDAAVEHQADPVEWVIQQHKEFMDFELLRKDKVAYARKVLEQAGEQTQKTEVAPAAQVTTQAAKPSIRSLTQVTTGSGSSSGAKAEAEFDWDAAFNPRKR